MIPIVFKVEDFATPALRAQAARLGSPGYLMDAAGLPVLNQIKHTLRAQPENKEGFRPRTNLYARFAEGATLAELPNGFGVFIPAAALHGRTIGLGFLLDGGPITAGTSGSGATHLVIAIDEQSYGKTPSDFAGQGLFLVKTSKGPYLCISTGKGARSSLVFLFKVMGPSLVMAARPQLLPSREGIIETVRRGLAGKWRSFRNN